MCTSLCPACDSEKVVFEILKDIKSFIFAIRQFCFCQQKAAYTRHWTKKYVANLTVMANKGRNTENSFAFNHFNNATM